MNLHTQNGPNSPDFEGSNLRPLNFYDKFQEATKNIQGFIFSPLVLYLVRSQIWVNYYFWMITTLTMSQNP
jgi:hypothetical protein